MTMKNVPVYIDIAFCMVFLPLMIYIFPIERSWGKYPVIFSIFILWLYVTYFLYKYFIIPGIFHGGKKRIYAFAMIAASLFVTFMFSRYKITSPLYHLRKPLCETYPFHIWGIRQNQQAIWVHYIIVVIFCVAVGMLNEAYRQRMAREEVEYERNKAELALYKAQINPHFLFNTLNTLYGLLITHSDKTEVTMERFINLVKYTYNNAGNDYIPLSEEVEYISQYIDLQKLRLNGFADVSFTHTEEDSTVMVPPMLLITFIENAFKYGISSNEPCFIHIRLLQKGGMLWFEAENSIFAREGGDSSRTGIENCRRRLSLLYPGQHTLTIDKNGENVFRVTLELQLHKTT